MCALVTGSSDVCSSDLWRWPSKSRSTAQTCPGVKARSCSRRNSIIAALHRARLEGRRRIQPRTGTWTSPSRPLERHQHDVDPRPFDILGRLQHALALEPGPRIETDCRLVMGEDLECEPPEIELAPAIVDRSEEHTSELQSLMRIPYA